MKKGFGKKLLDGAWSLTKGIVGINNPVVGAGMLVGELGKAGVGMAINKIKKNLTKNVESKVGGEGRVDWSGIIGSIAGLSGVVFMAYQVYIGAISVDDFIDFFMKYLKKLG